MKTNRLIINICSEKLQESKEFYTKLLGMKVNFDSDWYIQLVPMEESDIELGIIQKDHEMVPQGFRDLPRGSYLTFVVNDADALFRTAQKNGMPIVSEPEDTFYGQRRFLLTDPNGLLIDISSPIKDFQMQ